MNGNIIELTDLTKRYGSFTAVDTLNLAVKKGEIYGLLGPNGAGKSTAILMMLGLTQPTSGKAMVDGIDPVTNPIEVKKIVGYLPEDVGFYEDYTGLENLVYTAKLNGVAESEAKLRAASLMEKVGLQGEENKKAGKYSRGMRQRLGLADVLIKKPRILILDEPTLGIDPKGVNEFLRLIVALCKDEGHTILLSSHHLHQVQQICDRVGIFFGGKLIAEGNLQTLSRELLADDHIILEAVIVNPESNSGTASDSLRQSIERIEGVSGVLINNNIFIVTCKTDVSAQVAGTIVNSGFGLTSLNRKEFGLDEIYTRYFENNTDKQ